MDYVLCRPIYTYPSTINLIYYYTKVLIWGTTFIIRNQKCDGKKSGKGITELKATRPNFIPFLATSCLYQGGYVWVQVSLTQRLTTCHADLMLYHSWSLYTSRGVHLILGQPGLTHFWAGYLWLVLLSATRCLYWGFNLT